MKLSNNNNNHISILGYRIAHCYVWADLSSAAWSDDESNVP